jgi:hypothetical protein
LAGTSSAPAVEGGVGFGSAVPEEDEAPFGEMARTFEIL